MNSGPDLAQLQRTIAGCSGLLQLAGDSRRAAIERRIVEHGVLVFAVLQKVVRTIRGLLARRCS